MQGVGNPVSASGQGEKVGPQASSSCDRSFAFVGDLAYAEYDTTRKQSVDDLESHICEKNHDVFCYICCKFEVSNLRKKIDADIRSLYSELFSLEVDQHSKWVPHIICNSCRLMLYRWKKEKNDALIKYSSPAIWKEPRSINDCYFCANAIKGITVKNKHKIAYTSVTSVTEPLIADSNKGKTSVIQMDTSAYEDDEKVQVDESSTEEYNSDSDQDNSDEEYVQHTEKSKVLTLVSQLELNDLVRDLGLPKDGAEYLASFLKERNLLKPRTKVSVYRNCDREIRKYFTKDKDSSLVYCTDIKGLMDELKKNCYKAEDWRLFIDSSKRSIKAVLLHNTNVYAPVPIAHSTVMQEKYESMQVLLNKIDYKKHQWRICGDLKIITMLLGQQSGFTKYPCYLCLWDSRDRENHYKNIKWPIRSSFDPSSRNIIHESLVYPTKILIPPSTHQARPHEAIR